MTNPIYRALYFLPLVMVVISLYYFGFGVYAFTNGIWHIVYVPLWLIIFGFFVLAAGAQIWVVKQLIQLLEDEN